MEYLDTSNCKTVWNANDIIEQAESWSLAGDATILNSIKAIALNVLSKTEKLSEDVDNLLNNLDEVGLSLDIAQNEFHSLRNTQFIENRVYEDDETLDSNVAEKVEEKILPEDQEKSIFDSVVMGMSILDHYYDAVEVSLSDSEDESEKSFVLQPKDVYSQRALPPVIGTDEWYKKWNLEDSGSSNGSETDKVSEIYSESDSEDNLPKDLLKGSETSSELDFISQTSETRPVANSTFNDSVKKLDSATASDESGTEGSLPNKSPLSNRTFAEQLAAKLDSVISKDDNPRINSEQIKSDNVLHKKEELNKKPVKPAGGYSYGGIGGDLFSSEPPPLIDPPKSETGLFSGGKGLFDEIEDPLIWDELTNDTSTTQHDKQYSREVEKIDVPEKISFLPKSSQVSRGLFDSEDSSDEEDLFGFGKRTLDKPQFLRPNNRLIVPTFDDEPPELQTKMDSSSKSAIKNTEDDLSIYGSTNLFGNERLKNVLEKRQQNNVVNDFDIPKEQTLETKSKKSLENTAKQESVKKGLSLFDDADAFQDKQNNDKVSLFDDEFDNNTNMPSSKKKISLFDDDDDDDLFKNDLFDVKSKKQTSNLFDDLDNSNLFTSKNDNLINSRNEGKGYENKDINSNKTSVTLFDDHETFPKTEEMISHYKISDEMKHNDNSTDYSNNVNVNESAEQIFEEAEEEHTNSKRMSIETSPNNGNISVLIKKDNIETTLPSREIGKDLVANSIFGDTNQYGGTIEKESNLDKSAPKIRLFDSTPPPDDDDDWDTKSDNFSYIEDLTPYQFGGNLNRSNLFDDEPPSLDADESSGIVRDQNITRVDTDDSSFNPYASSSRRLSSDIFSDQQSIDGLFITKSRTDSATVSANLGIIPENSDTRSDNSDSLPNTNAIEDVLGQKNLPESKNSTNAAIFDDVFSHDNSSNVLSITDRKLNISGNELLTPGKTEVDGEVKMNKKLTANDDSTKSMNASVKTIGSPGKLKHNLNINVNALVPGYIPPKTKEFTKSHSIDSSTDKENKDQLNSRASTSTEDSLNGNIIKSVSFEYTDIEVLSSITKDRAKIPIKRRPSTRRGRQEAIRKSVIDNSLEHDNDAQSTEQKKSVEESVSTFMSSTQKDDMQKSENKIDKKTIEDPPSSTVESINNSKKLFGSESESDDDIFTSKKSERNQKTSNANKSLFEDSSSDDDLFKSGSRRGNEVKTDLRIRNTNKKSVIFKQMDNLEPSEDPLSDLLK